VKSVLVFLTDKELKPNAFGLAYLGWYYTLKGPTFVVTRGS
jgi:hypothetical protein